MKISEVERRTGLSRHTVRFYEEQGVIAPPTRGDNNYRDYDEGMVGELDFVRKAQPLGFALSEISAILAHMRNSTIDCVHGAMIVDARLEDVERRLRELRDIRKTLRQARSELVASALEHGLDVPPALEHLIAG